MYVLLSLHLNRCWPILHSRQKLHIFGKKRAIRIWPITFLKLNKTENSSAFAVGLSWLICSSLQLLCDCYVYALCMLCTCWQHAGYQISTTTVLQCFLTQKFWDDPYENPLPKKSFLEQLQTPSGSYVPDFFHSQICIKTKLTHFHKTRGFLAFY